VDRLRELARELEAVADELERQVDRPASRHDTDPAPPPESAQGALCDRVAEESSHELTIALQGHFSCVHCSARGPHVDISEDDRVGFRCASCGMTLGPFEIRLAVFATLARLAAERARDTGGGP
jgi:hypothetical protein